MQEKIMYEALGTKVIAVAVINFYDNGCVFDWTCYIDAVPGQDHIQEYHKVAKEGDKVRKEIAISIFPVLDSNKYRY